MNRKPTQAYIQSALFDIKSIRQESLASIYKAAHTGIIDEPALMRYWGFTDRFDVPNKYMMSIAAASIELQQDGKYKVVDNHKLTFELIAKLNRDKVRGMER